MQFKSWNSVPIFYAFLMVILYHTKTRYHIFSDEVEVGWKIRCLSCIIHLPLTRSVFLLHNTTSNGGVERSSTKGRNGSTARHCCFSCGVPTLRAERLHLPHCHPRGVRGSPPPPPQLPGGRCRRCDVLNTLYGRK
jgi:hypothetical protein